MRKELAPELKSLVSWSVDLLGKAITQEYGEKIFQQVEDLRQKMVTLRKKDQDKVFQELLKAKKKWAKESTETLQKFSHSFATMLELMNSCETAYRTFRLQSTTNSLPQAKPYAIIYVLTAHPTEARSGEFLGLFEAIQSLLVDALQHDESAVNDQLYHYLLIALKIPLARNEKPTVVDEAHNIYSHILKDDILDSLILFARQDVPVSLRTWVGGDKDGHPGVNEKTLIQSLGLSRKIIARYIQKKIDQAISIAELVHEQETKKIINELNRCQKILTALVTIRAKDGEKIRQFRTLFAQLLEDYKSVFKVESPALIDVDKLIWIFPALVVPLEIREDSEVVGKALKSDKPMPIEKMLVTLKDISEGYKPKWYVRGMIMSMVESADHMRDGLHLIEKVFGKYPIPLVPLFENAFALENATKILDEYFENNHTVLRKHEKHWGLRYEVMVGYSDSSKENGVFPGRLLIGNALKNLESYLLGRNLVPVFFHGSGGSVARGGGSIKEQTEWWPKSSLNIFKSTIQGEMVARNFANSSIFSSQVYKICDQLNRSAKKKVKLVNEEAVHRFAKLVQESYIETTGDDEFFDLVEKATPYGFLHTLKIGSRPNKRAQGGASRKLRAIPWILCWTQTRVLFPTWWGVGSAWEKLNAKEKKEYRRAYENNSVVNSYIKALGFTMAKVELGVFRLYLHESGLTPTKQKAYFNLFVDEFEKTARFYRSVTGKRSYMWFRPWLEQSIAYRSSMIHPLNIIQLEALARNDEQLLRGTVTGIACGMLTTG